MRAKIISLRMNIKALESNKSDHGVTIGCGGGGERSGTNTPNCIYKHLVSIELRNLSFYFCHTQFSGSIIFSYSSSSNTEPPILPPHGHTQTGSQSAMTTMTPNSKIKLDAGIRVGERRKGVEQGGSIEHTVVVVMLLLML